MAVPPRRRRRRRAWRGPARRRRRGAHDRRGDDAAHALGLDRGGQVGVGLVDHEGAGERRVEPGHADDRSPRGRARRSRRSAGPLSAAPATIGDTATTCVAAGRRPPRARRARPAPGPIDTIGFDGATTTASAAVDGVEHARGRAGPRRRRRSAPPTPARACWRCTKYSWKPISMPAPSPGSVDAVVRSGSSVDRQQAQPEAPRRGDLGGDRGQVGALGQALGAVQVGAEVAVAEVEPAHRRRSGSSISIACQVSPARPQPRLGVDGAGERVGDRVEVGADVQAVQHEVVADVDDRGEVARGRPPARGRPASGPRRRRRRAR